jgi:Cu+-exporting ATPase
VTVVRSTETAGRGVDALVHGPAGLTNILIGNQPFLADRRVPLPSPFSDLLASSATVIYAVAEGQPVAAFTVEDPLRSSSAAAVKELGAMGLKVIMATGDRQTVAASVAGRLGILDVRAELLPAGKRDLVAALKAAGERVAMVGDGINDAPALAEADVGIAVGGGTDIAMDAAAIVIPLGNLAKVAEAIRISRTTMRVIRQNLGWAFMYNILAIPVAASGRLSPMIAAAAMACSSLSVVGNSLRLRRQQTGGPL